LEVAFGSDWAVSTPNALLEMEVAVTRVGPGGAWQRAVSPQERLDLMTAVEAFTMGSAMVETVVRGRVVYERSR
jgi:predicted amidohydrolase YtcJ